MHKSFWINLLVNHLEDREGDEYGIKLDLGDIRCPVEA
jgi:hypothetical protein